MEPVKIGLVGYGFGGRYFHAALPGSSADNDGWLARKSAVVDRYGLSSLHVGEQFRVVSGLPELEDHRLVVETLSVFLTTRQ